MSPLTDKECERILAEYCEKSPIIPMESEPRKKWFHDLIRLAYDVGFEDGFAQ